jgi:hypothetical protein
MNKFPHRLFLLTILSLFALAAIAQADDQFYGSVESFDGGSIVVKTTKHSTGNWKVDSATKVSVSVEAGDWVSVHVATSGHVQSLKFEERPTAHAGVIKEIKDNVLRVHSGPDMVNWNLTETTQFSGITRADLAVGDEIGVKLYKNHNLATVRVIKTGVK